VTIHNSKGLEYPIVFCPSHWADKKLKDVLFHDPDHDWRLTLDLSDSTDDLHDAAAFRELLAEEVRLFYVAVTRAVQRCYLYTPHRKDPSKTALGVVLGNNLREACRTLAETAPSRFTIRSLRTAQELVDVTVLATPPTLRVRELLRRPSSERMIGSFSQLVAGATEESPKDHDEMGDPDESRDNAVIDTTPLARLPRGAATGIALHAVLEHADFQREETLAPLVAQHFGSMNLDNDALDAITQHLSSMMSHPLNAGAHMVRLNDIAPSDRLNEVEFYYPITRFDSKTLSAATALTSSRLQFNPVDGYLRGFMDLVFRHDGRYYLLDWKSNWLGPRSSDYSKNHLEHTMSRSFYSLQSWLYALALDRFLAQRVSGYRFEVEFGGIFYIFVRGLNPTSPEHGVHFSKPDAAFIKLLGEKLLRRGTTQ
jgi:exodeoxyribonuclease V beta subunit